MFTFHVQNYSHTISVLCAAHVNVDWEGLIRIRYLEVHISTSWVVASNPEVFLLNSAISSENCAKVIVLCRGQRLSINVSRNEKLSIYFASSRGHELVIGRNGKYVIC